MPEMFTKFGYYQQLNVNAELWLHKISCIFIEKYLSKLQRKQVSSSLAGETLLTAQNNIMYLS